MYKDKMELAGRVTLLLKDYDGHILDLITQDNLITEFGDQYYADRAAGIGAIPAVTGMKLGTGVTAAAKTGAGAALVAYMVGTNRLFDVTPTSTLVSGTRKLTYTATWGAGVGTGSPQEIVIVSDASTNATSTAGVTIARVVLSSPPAKASDGIWTCIWEHNFLGV